MDITPETKRLIEQVQQLKPNYTDAASQLFLDFYCQCREGCDYLFPPEVRTTVRLLDILQWFLDCAEKGGPTQLVRLMWKDVEGPTLGDYLQDEKIERGLNTAFSTHLTQELAAWDRIMLPSGNAHLLLKDVLQALHQVEQAQRRDPVFER
ncbi:MAG: hypothetical protein ACKO7W_04765 [Elainella sp.]